MPSMSHRSYASNPPAMSCPMINVSSCVLLRASSMCAVLSPVVLHVVLHRFMLARTLVSSFMWRWILSMVLASRSTCSPILDSAPVCVSMWTPILDIADVSCSNCVWILESVVVSWSRFSLVMDSSIFSIVISCWDGAILSVTFWCCGASDSVGAGLAVSFPHCTCCVDLDISVLVSAHLLIWSSTEGSLGARTLWKFKRKVLPQPVKMFWKYMLRRKSF